MDGISIILLDRFGSLWMRSSTLWQRLGWANPRVGKRGTCGYWLVMSDNVCVCVCACVYDLEWFGVLWAIVNSHWPLFCIIWYLQQTILGKPGPSKSRAHQNTPLMCTVLWRDSWSTSRLYLDFWIWQWKERDRDKENERDKAKDTDLKRTVEEERDREREIKRERERER